PLGATEDRVLPDMVRDGDGVEPGGLGGVRHGGERRSQALRASVPAKAVDVEAKFHDGSPFWTGRAVPSRAPRWSGQRWGPQIVGHLLLPSRMGLMNQMGVRGR